MKGSVIDAAADIGCDLTTYVPSHPMAGGEKSGGSAARETLFDGRPWAVCPTPVTSDAALAAARIMVRLVGGDGYEIDARAHDRAMAMISHVPHLLASVLAAQLADAERDALALAGRGIRDTTRIAGGGVSLWTEIVAGNAEPIADILDRICGGLQGVARELRTRPPPAYPAAGDLVELLTRGKAGRERLLDGEST